MLASHAPSGTGLIIGRVLQTDTLTPVHGAALRLVSSSGVSPVDIVRTNDRGDFVIAHLPKGRWFICVSKSGYLQAGTPRGEEIVLAEDARIVDLVLLVIRSSAISGAITDQNGRPRVGAQATLFERRVSSGWHPAGTATTDDRGVYRFSSLRPGEYMVTAAASTAAARQIMLPSGGHQGSVDFQVPRGATEPGGHGGVITGRVTDEHGDPIAATVQILALDAATGELVVVPAARPPRARTDDRGVYRVHGLPPGTYYVGVAHGAIGAGIAGHETTPADIQRARAHIAGAGAMEAPEPRLTVYAPTFHPDATTLADAIPVTLVRREERAGVDMTVPLVRGVSLAGVVVAPDGSVPHAAGVTLIPDRPYIPASQVLSSAGSGTAWSLGGVVTPPVTSAGQFTILSLTPGRYTLVAHDQAFTRMSARTTITLGEQDQTSVVITLQPGPAARGLPVSAPPQARNLRIGPGLASVAGGR